MKTRKLTDPRTGRTYLLQPNGDVDEKVFGVCETIPVSNPDELVRIRKLFAARRGASMARAARDDAMRSLGLTKVRGAVTGKVYWE